MKNIRKVGDTKDKRGKCFRKGKVENCPKRC